MHHAIACYTADWINYNKLICFWFISVLAIITMASINVSKQLTIYLILIIALTADIVCEFCTLSIRLRRRTSRSSVQLRFRVLNCHPRTWSLFLFVEESPELTLTTLFHFISSSWRDHLHQICSWQQAFLCENFKL